MRTKAAAHRTPTVRFCALASLLAAGLACGAPDTLDEPPATPATEVTGVVSQSLNPAAPPMCVFGADLVRIGAESKVYSDVGSNIQVDIQAGRGPAPRNTLVVGDVTSRGRVFVGGAHGNVEGTARANDEVTVQDGSSVTQVFDHLVHTADEIPYRNIPLKTVRPGNIYLSLDPGSTACNGTRLDPGQYQYAGVAVRRTCNLTLAPGEHHFGHLDIDAEATLIVEGPVQVYTKYQFRFADRAVLQGIRDPYDLQVYTDGGAFIGNGVNDFRGLLTAKYGVFVGTGSQITGCIQARDITLNPQVTLHHAGTTDRHRVRRALMEVEISSPDSPVTSTPRFPNLASCPTSVELSFPEGRHQGRDYGRTVVELGKTLHNGATFNCSYSEIIDQRPTGICDHRDHPCVHHPDQWDNVELSWGGTNAIPLDGLRVTNFEAVPGTTGPSGAVGPYYNLVLTDGTHVHSGLYSEPLHSYEQDPGNAAERNVLPTGFSLSPTPQPLSELIQERRRAVTEWIIWNAYQANPNHAFGEAERADVDFDALPRAVREGAYDQGQVGDYKIVGDGIYDEVLGACSGTQTFYQLNYTERYETDFRNALSNPLHPYECHFDPVTLRHYCQNGPGTWPNPPPANPAAAASLHTWGDEISINAGAGTRVLAKAVFDATSQQLDGFERVDAVGPHPGGNTWNTDGTPYNPKPGDFFWRFDRCWHGGGIRHAMILVAEPYTDGTAIVAATTLMNAPMLDGSSMIRLRDYDFSAEVDPTVSGSFPTLCSTASVSCDCVDSEGRANPDTVPESYDCNPANLTPDLETGVDYAAAVTSGANCLCWGPRPLMCPVGLGGTSPRYEYYVGESYSAHELFVVSQNTDPDDPPTRPFDWSRISDDLITQPSFDATEPHARPTLDQLQFARFDSDIYHDILWQRPGDTFALALSGGEGYSRWEDTERSAASGRVHLADLGQFDAATGSIDTQQDDSTDLIELRSSGSQIEIWAAFKRADVGPLFSPWVMASSFEAGGRDLAYWQEHVRFADFNGDEVTDILRDLDGNWVINFLSGVPDWHGTFRDVAQYQFADLDYDGHTDIVARRDDAAGIRWEWTQLQGIQGWTPWEEFSRELDDCDIANLRFVNWDGDTVTLDTAVADMFCLSGDGDWRLVQQGNANGPPVHARLDSVQNIAFGNFRTAGDVPGADQVRDDVLHFGGSPIEGLF